MTLQFIFHYFVDIFNINIRIITMLFKLDSFFYFVCKYPTSVKR